MKSERTVPEYKLLDRWKRYSGLSVKDFPTSEIAFKVLVEWAKAHLRSRAKALNLVYADQEEYQRKVQKTCSSATDDPRLTIDILRHEGNWLNNRVTWAKEEYLGFWDLVAEGKEGSTRILKGPEWQDPEAFRLQVLRETNRQGNGSNETPHQVDVRV